MWNIRCIVAVHLNTLRLALELTYALFWRMFHVDFEENMYFATVDWSVQYMLITFIVLINTMIIV